MNNFRCKYLNNKYKFKDEKWWIISGTNGWNISELRNESVINSLNEIMDHDITELSEN